MYHHMNTEIVIIIGPEVEVYTKTNSIHFISSAPNPELLRHAVLYWDKLDFPQNNLVHIEASSDIDFLKQEGIAQQTNICIAQSGDFATLYLQAQFDAFKLLNQKEPDKWTIGQYTKNLIQPTVGLAEKHVIEMEINELLPVPPEDIPLADILELKQKRKDEFALLRVSIDELFDNALKWESLPRGKNAAITNLKNVITDIRKFVDTSWLIRGASLKLEFNLPTIVKGFLTGLALTESIGIPGLEYIGALSSPIKFEKKFGISALPENTKQFAALYYLEKQFPGSIKKPI